MRGRLNRSWLAVVEVLSDQRIPTVLQMLASNKTSAHACGMDRTREGTPSTTCRACHWAKADWKACH